MRRANFFSGLWVDYDLLNYEVTAKDESIKNRIKGILNSSAIGAGSGSIVGIMGDSALAITQTDPGYLEISPGEAIDVNGEYINVPQDVDDVEDTDFEPSKPSRTISMDSLGIIEDVTYYVGIQYAAASGCLKSNRDGEVFATRYYDSYEYVASSGSLASPAITLATVITTGGGGIATISDTRGEQWLSCQVDARKVFIDNTPLAAMETLQDHVNMIGNSDLVSITNPHGTEVYQNFDNLVNQPTGLSGGLVHGQDAHDESVPRTFIASSNVDDALAPTKEGGGIVWCDGYFDQDTDATEEIILDNSIDWRYRWVSTKGFAIPSTEGDEYLPGGTKAANISGYYTVGYPARLVYGYLYSYSGSDGTTEPYVDLMVVDSTGSNVSKLRVWVDSSTGALTATVSDWGAASGLFLAYALAIEYGPIRQNV